MIVLQVLALLAQHIGVTRRLVGINAGRFLLIATSSQRTGDAQSNRKHNDDTTQTAENGDQRQSRRWSIDSHWRW